MNLSEKNLKNLIDRLECPFNFNEAHGYLCGFACTNLVSNQYQNAIKVYFFKDTQDSSIDINDISIVNGYINFLETKIKTGYINLPFDDYKKTIEKIKYMSQWSKNFFLSLNIIANNKYIENVTDLRDILKDLKEIAKIENEYIISDSNEDSEYYKDISNYVVNTIYQIYTQTLSQK